MSREDQRRATRVRLLTHARELFAEHGYAAVSIPDVARAAGVTKGALYHQFTGKAEVFEAVLEQAQQEVGESVAAAADVVTDPFAALLAGCRAFLEAATAPAVRRVLLVDGPALVGWERWRELDEQASASHLAEALAALMDDGVLARRPVAPLTRLLSGAMNEAALWLARPDAMPSDLDDATTALAALLAGLRVT